jgi:hypothetical protein
MKNLAVFALLVFAIAPTRGQGLLTVLSTLDVHPVVGFTANINSQMLVGPSWGINLATYDRFSTGAGFTRAGFGPFLGFRAVWILHVQGQWNALLFNQNQGEPRFSVGLFIPV